MKRTFRKLFFVTVFMVLMTVVLCFGVSALAETGQCGDNVYWKYSSSTETLNISGNGAMYDYDSQKTPFSDSSYYISAVVIESGVTRIGNAAFQSCRDVISITIPDTVMSIGLDAFKWCYRLENFVIDEDNRYYSNDEEGVLFNKDKTLLIRYPIGNEREEYVIPNSVTSIGDAAFQSCRKITKLTIPDSVTSISDLAFCQCESLENFFVDEDNQYYSNNEEGVLFNKDKTFLIRYPIGNEREEYVIPNSVTNIGDTAFQSCINITNLIISNSVTSIGDASFDGCLNLSNIIIGDNVTIIGDSAFCGCWKLKSITIPDRVTSIGEQAFEACSWLTSITVNKDNLRFSSDEYGVLFNKNHTELIRYPAGNTRISYAICDSVISICDSAFSNCDSLRSVTIPDSVTSIGDSAFRGCEGLKNITIPDGITSIGDFMFSGCWHLSSVTISDSVTTIGAYAFNSCYDLTSITIPDGVTTIGERAFYDCDSLRRVTIPDSVTSIGDSAFSSCDELTRIIIPVSVTNIGKKAFYDCDELKDVYYNGTQEQWESIENISYSYLINKKIHYNYCGPVHKNIVDVAQQNPSCTEVGYTAGKQCSHCKEWISGHEEIPATDHSYTATVTTSPTCISKGVKTYVCQNDNTHTYTEKIAVDSANHVNKADIPQQDATCESVGYTAGVYCNDCKKWISGHSKISATGHTYKTTTTKATLAKNGSIVTACTVCGTKKSTTTIYSPKTFTLSTTKYIHDGKNKTPKLTVKDANGKTLVKNTDYKTSVASKRSGIGRYTVKVTFMGKYEGTKNLYFYILPGATSNVKASGQTISSLKLSWSAVPGAVGYKVYRYSPSKKAYVSAGTTTKTSITVSKLLEGTKYTFRVYSYGKTSAGKVYDSEKYTLIKTATCTEVPEITSVKTSSIKGRVYIYHSDESGETGYTVYYSTSKTSGFKKYKNYDPNTTSATVSNLTSGKTYYFKIRTYIKTDSGYVYSPFSAVKSVKVK